MKGRKKVWKKEIRMRRGEDLGKEKLPHTYIVRTTETMDTEKKWKLKNKTWWTEKKWITHDDSYNWENTWLNNTTL